MVFRIEEADPMWEIIITALFLCALITFLWGLVLILPTKLKEVTSLPMAVRWLLLVAGAGLSIFYLFQILEQMQEHAEVMEHQMEIIGLKDPDYSVANMSVSGVLDGELVVCDVRKLHPHTYEITDC